MDEGKGRQGPCSAWTLGSAGLVMRKRLTPRPFNTDAYTQTFGPLAARAAFQTDCQAGLPGLGHLPREGAKKIWSASEDILAELLKALYGQPAVQTDGRGSESGLDTGRAIGGCSSIGLW